MEDLLTGAVRRASTLSGGESFQGSLALSLGLAEVVLERSGGRKLETLFIDEGFGSLDAEALEASLQVLGRLQETGKHIGIISHLREFGDLTPRAIRCVPRGAKGSTIIQPPLRF